MYFDLELQLQGLPCNVEMSRNDSIVLEQTVQSLLEDKLLLENDNVYYPYTIEGVSVVSDGVVSVCDSNVTTTTATMEATTTELSSRRYYYHEHHENPTTTTQTEEQPLQRRRRELQQSSLSNQQQHLTRVTLAIRASAPSNDDDFLANNVHQILINSEVELVQLLRTAGEYYTFLIGIDFEQHHIAPSFAPSNSPSSELELVTTTWMPSQMPVVGGGGEGNTTSLATTEKASVVSSGMISNVSIPSSVMLGYFVGMLAATYYLFC